MNKPHTSEQAASVLARFLDTFAVPVEGHARDELTTEQQDLLRRLANGELEENLRTNLVPLLASNEVAMEFLAESAR